MVHQNEKISLNKGGVITPFFQNQKFSLIKGGVIKGGGLLFDPVYLQTPFGVSINLQKLPSLRVFL